MKRKTAAEIEQDVDALRALDIKALRARWRDVLKTEPPPKMQSGFLRLAIAYRLQEEVHGCLGPAAVRKLRQYTKSPQAGSSATAPDSAPGKLVAALSGMRIEEIYRLRVADCEGGMFSIRSGKTVNAKRLVPINIALRPIVERLAKGKAPAAFLIDAQTPIVESTGLRSGAATKAFTRYRRGCGADERPNDKSKSNVDFHSLRRWFITQAEAALGGGPWGIRP